MSKIAINNEIVLMRQEVRKARVAVVRKLIKEAKLLQARKHGNEKTIEKCKRKGQRLVAEIVALKKIKDDDITRFAITNTKKLAEVLNDCTSESGTRIMCRLTFHKTLANRITKFKEKFPEYEQHLGPGRKKLSKIQRQANREARNAMKHNPGITANGKKATQSEEMAHKNEPIEENVVEHSDESGDDEDEDTENSEETTEFSDGNGGSNFTELANRISKGTDEEDLSSGSKKPRKIKRESKKKTKKAIEGKVQGSKDRAQKNQTVGENKSGNKEHRISDDSNEATDAFSNYSKVNSEINKADRQEEIDGSMPEDCSEPGSILRVKTPSSSDKTRKREKAADSLTKDSTPVTPKKAKINTFKKDKKSKQQVSVSIGSVETIEPKPIKVISKEASVKRFADLANDSEEIVREAESVGRLKRRDVKIEKEVDSFFMTENGESEYLSVVVPKSKLCEDDVQDERFGQNHAAKRQMNIHERNNRFFSKIDERGSGSGYGDKHIGNVAGRKRSINLPNTEGGLTKKFGRERSGRNVRPDFEKKIEAKEDALHPSWAARKKQQEILKQGFQGKKIVFDD